MKITTFAKITFMRLYKKYLWLSQYTYIKYLERNFKTEKININNYSTENILIIVPHADDELIGCFQIIKNNPNNVRLFYLGFTGEDKSDENYNTRLNEFKLFCDKLCIHYYISDLTHIISLQKTIETYKPDIIFTPSLVDWHKEHFQSNKILFEIISKSSKIFTIYQYQISVPIPSEYATHFVSMTKSEQLFKWNMFKTIYVSQINIPYYRFKLNENISGYNVFHYASEFYIKLSLEEFECGINAFNDIITNKTTENLKQNINHLKKIRKLSSMLHFQLFKQTKS